MAIESSWTKVQLLQFLDQYESELRESGKTRNTINTYVQHPERFIKWLPGSPKVAAKRLEPPNVALARSGSKYEALRQYLNVYPGMSVWLNFQQIEENLGQKLPNSARRHAAWWANEKTGSHSHARAWMDVGFKTSRIDVKKESVMFGRADSAPTDNATVQR